MHDLAISHPEGDPIIGKRDKFPYYKRRIENVTHKYLEVRLRKLYNEKYECYSPDSIMFEYHTPDLVVKGEGGKYAIEIKVEFTDFQRSLFQCRSYFIEGHSPYVIAPEEIFEGREEFISRIYNEIPYNMPGLMLAVDDRIELVSEPRYRRVI